MLCLYITTTPPGLVGIPAENFFQFTPTTIAVGDPLTVDCVVITTLSDARASISWLSPESSVIGSVVGASFEERNGRLEARLPIDFTSFTADGFGEYTCLATVESPSSPGTQTSLFRTVEIPTTSKPLFPTC